MPITNLDSWLPTLQEFINHWTQVNTELGPGGPLVLLGSYNVAGLTKGDDKGQNVVKITRP